MDKIKAVKNMYQMPSEYGSNSDTSVDFYRIEESLKALKERELYLSELDTKCRELKREVETTKESLCTERQLLIRKVQELTVSEDCLNEIKLDKNTLLLEVHQLDTQRNALRNTKPNPKDQRTIELGMKKFNYYKQLTGVRWDFGAPRGTVKGYLANGMNYIHSFNYKANEHASDLKDLLWREIEEASERSSITEGDENKTPNS